MLCNMHTFEVILFYKVISCWEQIVADLCATVSGERGQHLNQGGEKNTETIAAARNLLASSVTWP